ncbi:hypothetical protein DFS34DRAFT_325722 [Phlyctochytrium arcticum]|nr:hypothetical protein DFS34DRAFT_325722 [Phlyctochytrium arcticum]
MLYDLQGLRTFMREDHPLNMRQDVLRRFYEPIAQSFKEWWDVYRTEITGSMDTVPITSLDGRIVRSAEAPNVVASQTTELDEGNIPRQILPEGQKMGTEIFTRDETDAGSTDHELKKQVAQLHAVMEFSRRIISCFRFVMSNSSACSKRSNMRQ